MSIWPEGGQHLSPGALQAVEHPMSRLQARLDGRNCSPRLHTELGMMFAPAALHIARRTSMAWVTVTE